MASDLVCFSHLRWDFVYQRPQHLMSRWARTGRVFFVEEPISCDPSGPSLHVRQALDRLTVVVPALPDGLTPADATALQARLLSEFASQHVSAAPVLWYYTPMALAFSQRLHASVIVYDCMDELCSFRAAPRELRRYEAELFNVADIVFTGGWSLYEAKRRFHARTHCVPSAVDIEHFASARSPREDPDDQRDIPLPRIGYCGVIDERMDLSLIDTIAARRPDWQLVMLGPVVKIDDRLLPRRANIHYLGLKRYAELPDYLGHWRVAMLPFARDESTRWISPTKTPEYLAAGIPVVTTPVRDVVRSYGRTGHVAVAGDADEFIAAIDAAVGAPRSAHHPRLARQLARASWDRTWARMVRLIESAATQNH